MTVSRLDVPGSPEARAHSADAAAVPLAGQTGAERGYRPVGAVLRRSAAAFGTAPFLVSGERRLSFAELDAAADRAASGLLRIGIGRGDHVGLWLGNGVEWVVWFFACARLGAAIVPVSTRYKAEEMGYVVAHSGCKALIVSGPRWGIDFFQMLSAIAPELAGQEAGKLQLERFPALRHVLLAQSAEAGPAGTRTLASLETDPASPEAVAEAEREVTVDDVLMISYTSGTTGAPKGVMLDHKVVAQATRVGRALHMEQGDSVLGHMPLYHVAGLFMALFPALVLGARLVIVEDWHVGSALRTIEQERVTIFGGISDAFPGSRRRAEPVRPRPVEPQIGLDRGIERHPRDVREGARAGSVISDCSAPTA